MTRPAGPTDDGEPRVIGVECVPEACETCPAGSRIGDRGDLIGGIVGGGGGPVHVDRAREVAIRVVAERDRVSELVRRPGQPIGLVVRAGHGLPVRVGDPGEGPRQVLGVLHGGAAAVRGLCQPLRLPYVHAYVPVPSVIPVICPRGLYVKFVTLGVVPSE